MYEPLGKKKAIEAQEVLNTNGGTYFDGQLDRYHALNQPALEAYLSNLTEESIQREDTRLNLMTRRFFVT
jgi:hypothetical protein